MMVFGFIRTQNYLAAFLLNRNLLCRFSDKENAKNISVNMAFLLTTLCHGYKPLVVKAVCASYR